MHLQDTIRSELWDFAPYTPGRSIAEIREAYGLTQVVKMASNENPLGTSPQVRKTLEHWADMVFRYPRANSPQLTQALSRHLGLPPEHFVLGNGSDEIIDLLIRVKARPGQDRIAVFQPSFSIYHLQARLCGVQLTQVPLNSDFSFPYARMLDQVDERTAMLFLTSPDNPSGFAASRRDLRHLARDLPEQTLLVVDEAYIEFAPDQKQHSLLSDLPELSNVVLLRTFSKLYGLAGLRLGYGIMPAWLADLLRRVKLPFSVNLLAEEAGRAALQDGAFIQATLEIVSRGRNILSQGFVDLGWTVYPSQANFLLVKPTCNPKTLVERLLSRGYIIRSLDSYGLPDFVRISIGTDTENRGLLRACRQISSHA